MRQGRYRAALRERRRGGTMRPAPRRILPNPILEFGSSGKRWRPMQRRRGLLRQRQDHVSEPGSEGC